MAGFKMVYNFEPSTGRYIGAEPLEYSLEDGSELMPANSTLIKPLPRIDERFVNYWDGEKWVLKLDPDKARIMLARRNAALLASDWTMLKDSPLWFWERWKWRQYRTKLRELPKDPLWPFVELPEAPNKNGHQ